jgi:DNA-binding response OmpR family regulator
MELLSAVLLCGDSGTLAVARKVLEEHGVTVKVSANTSLADQLMKRTRFDLAVLDCDVPGAMQLASPETIYAPKMIFGLVRPDKMDGIRGKRVHFVVTKPFSGDLLGKSLRAAFGSMLRDRRASFRHPVNIHPTSCVVIHENSERRVPGTVILDVSQTGMCLQTKEILQQGAILKIDFPLPESKQTLELTGSIQWNLPGKAGVKFAPMTAEQKAKLVGWLESMMPYDSDFVTLGAAASARSM